jgi:hypothetical protein
MSVKPFLDDKARGLKRFWRDNGDGTASIVTQQDVGEIVEDAKDRANGQNYSAGRFMGNKWGASAAVIPVAVQLKWLNEEGLDIFNPDHADRLKAKLNDPDYAYLRTNHFKV